MLDPVMFGVSVVFMILLRVAYFVSMHILNVWEAFGSFVWTFPRPNSHYMKH